MIISTFTRYVGSSLMFVLVCAYGIREEMRPNDEPRRSWGWRRWDRWPVTRVVRCVTALIVSGWAAGARPPRSPSGRIPHRSPP
jgi:hypothetical protein